VFIAAEFRWGGKVGETAGENGLFAISGRPEGTPPEAASALVAASA
jgi:hypothetical protein